MAAIRPRHNRFEAKVRIPLAHRPYHDGREFLYRTLKATSRKLAQIEADQWENALRVQWAEREGLAQDARSTLRRVYEDTLQAAAAGRDLLPENHAIGKLARQMETSDAARPFYRGSDHRRAA